MIESGNIRYDDLSLSLQQKFNQDYNALLGNKNTLNYGWELNGQVKRIDDTDPALRYSGRWKSYTQGGAVVGEGINGSFTQAMELGEWVEVSFVGTDLYIGAYFGDNTAILGVSVDGQEEYPLDFYMGTNTYDSWDWGRDHPVATGLPLGAHIVRLSIRSNNPNSEGFYFSFSHFTVSTGKKSGLFIDPVQKKSSAVIKGKGIETALNFDIPNESITNMITNADFQRRNPIWGTVYKEDFNRSANKGEVGNGWTSEGGTVTSSRLQLSSPDERAMLALNLRSYEATFGFIPSDNTSYIYLGMDTKNGTVNPQKAGWTRVALTGSTIGFQHWNRGSMSTNPTTAYALKSSTMYYVKCRVVSGLYQFSISTNPDFVTDAVTIYSSFRSFSSNGFGIERASANTSYIALDDLVIKAPVPYGWDWVAVTNYKFNGKIFSVLNEIAANGIAQSKIPVVAANTKYTFSVKYKLNKYTSGNGAYARITWLDSSENVIANSDSAYIITPTMDSFATISFSATSPIGSAKAIVKLVLEGSGNVEWKEPMFMLDAQKDSAFHTYESRMDVVVLNDKGEYTAVRGNGENEIAYRVEENVLQKVTKWYKPKEEVLHWDRIKMWRGGDAWVVRDRNSASGSSQLIANGADQTFYISFVGTGIDVIGSIGNSTGIMEVTIDDEVSKELVDLYSPANKYQVVVYSIKGLAYGQHTVRLRSTGTKNTMSVDTYIAIDAFDIYVPKSPTISNENLALGHIIRTNENSGWIRYNHMGEGVLSYRFAESSSRGFYNGSEYEGSDPASFLDIRFIGERFRWIGLKAPAVGIANVSLDGKQVAQVDGYGESTFGVILADLKMNFGYHNIVISQSGSSNPSASGKVITFDAYDIQSTMYTCTYRKNIVAQLIAKEIERHEAKSLHEAHTQALKGMYAKERVERGVRAIATSASDSVAYGQVTFNDAFTNPPQVMAVVSNSNVQGSHLINVSATSITSTGFQLEVGFNTTVARAAGTTNINWIAIGD